MLIIQDEYIKINYLPISTVKLFVDSVIDIIKLKDLLSYTVRYITWVIGPISDDFIILKVAVRTKFPEF
jgi:hypothetical protein